MERKKRELQKRKKTDQRENAGEKRNKCLPLPGTAGEGGIDAKAGEKVS